MQVNDNLIRNMDRSGKNPMLNEAIKRSEDTVEEFKNSMQLRIAENDKKLTIEKKPDKKPVEKTRLNENLKSKDNKSKKIDRVDDVTYSKAASVHSNSANSSSEVKTDNTALNGETKVLEAKAILNTDNMVKNMLIMPNTEELPFVNATGEIAAAEENTQILFGNSVVEELKNSDIEESKNHLNEISFGAKGTDEIKSNATDKAASQNEKIGLDEIKDADIKEIGGLFKELKHTAGEDTKTYDRAGVNAENTVSLEINPNEDRAVEYSFNSGSDEEGSSKKEEKIEFDISDRLVNTVDHKASKAVTDNVNADLNIETTDNVSEDNELRIQVIERIADYMNASSISKNDTLELMLNPASLGKLMMQVKQTASGVAVSILCEAEKTYHLLKDRSGEIAGILAKKLEEPVMVNVHPDNRQDYLNQNNKDNSKDAFYEQQSRQQEERQNRRAADEATSFLSRLRLGIN